MQVTGCDYNVVALVQLEVWENHNTTTMVLKNTTNVFFTYLKDTNRYCTGSHSPASQKSGQHLGLRFQSCSIKSQAVVSEIISRHQNKTQTPLNIYLKIIQKSIRISQIPKGFSSRSSRAAIFRAPRLTLAVRSRDTCDQRHAPGAWNRPGRDLSSAIRMA